MKIQKLQLFFLLHGVIMSSHFHAGSFINRFNVYDTWFKAMKEEERLVAKKTIIKNGAIACGIIAIPVIGVILAKYGRMWLPLGTKNEKEEIQEALHYVEIFKQKKGDLTGAIISVGNEPQVLLGETHQDITLQITVDARILNFRDYPLIKKFAYALTEKDEYKTKKMSIFIYNKQDTAKFVKYVLKPHLGFMIDPSSVIKRR